MKVVLLAPWMGATPRWFDRFAARLAPFKDWLELRFMPERWAHLRQRIHQATGVFPPREVQPRKLCDYRPAFGHVFAGELRGADWWGWCDLDCVFGDLELLLPHLEAHDVVTDHPSIVNGPLALFRNVREINELYLLADPRRIFGHRRHVAFDEKGFTELVKNWVGPRAAFLPDVHTSNYDEPAPRVDGRKLFSSTDGRELITYHFPRKPKAWPL